MSRLGQGDLLVRNQRVGTAWVSRVAADVAFHPRIRLSLGCQVQDLPPPQRSSRKVWSGSRPAGLPSRQQRTVHAAPAATSSPRQGNSRNAQRPSGMPNHTACGGGPTGVRTIGVGRFPGGRPGPGISQERHAHMVLRSPVLPSRSGRSDEGSVTPKIRLERSSGCHNVRRTMDLP